MAFYPKGFAYTRAFKMIDSADHFSKKTGLTCTVNISKAGAAFAAAAGAVSEIANGWYKVALSTVDAGTAGDLAFYITASGADDTDFVDQVFDASTANLGVNTVNIGGVTQTGRDLGLSVLLSSGTGTGQVDFTSGVVKANATQWLGGTIPAVNITGVPLVDLKYTLGTISPAAAGSVRADAVTGAVGSVTGAVGSVAANGITAASIATNAIDADALAADAITEMRSMFSGTSDSGTTTTMVDAARIAVGFDNFFKGGMIWFTSGTNIGQARLITASDGATGTLTFDPSVAAAVTTENYEILPACRVDLKMWLGVNMNTAIGGNVPANMQAGAAGVITSTVAPNLDAAVSTRATPTQVNAEVVDALNVDTYAEPAQSAPAATASLVTKLGFLFKAWRNRQTQTSTTYSLYNDDALTVDHKSTVSDDGATFNRTEVGSGP